jgi:hypothetical protein
MAAMAAGFYTMGPTMMRPLAALPTAAIALLVLAPAALAHDGGEGWYGPADDKVVTNAGFILIVFFPLFVFLMSTLQGHLEKRKDRRKKAHKALAGDEQVRGGW